MAWVVLQSTWDNAKDVDRARYGDEGKIHGVSFHMNTFRYLYGSSMLQELLLKHAGNLSWTLQHKSRVPWMSTSGVDDCRDSQRNLGRWAIIPILDKGDQQIGSYLRGCTGAISKKKSAHAFWSILHENSETPPSSGIHRSQQYHHRLHPGPARLTWTYLASYIRIAGNAGM